MHEFYQILAINILWITLIGTLFLAGAKIDEKNCHGLKKTPFNDIIHTH